MNTVKISVIIPVFNVSKWISRCVQSVLHQTFTDFEIILVDDGSTDNSLEICQMFAQKYDCVKVFHKNNGGLSDARNYGVKHSTGKYIVFIDSDDYVENDYLVELYKVISSTSSDLAICEYNMVEENEKYISSKRFNIPLGISTLSGKKLLPYIYDDSGVVIVVAWNKIYKKSIFESLSFEKGRLFEDEYLIVNLLWQVKKVTLIRKPLYNYVQRKGSIIKTRFTLKKANDVNTFMLRRIKFFKDKNNEELYKLAVQNYKDWIIGVTRYKTDISDELFWKYLQKQFRQLVRIKSSNSVKKRVKDIIGYLNIGIINKIILYKNN